MFCSILCSVFRIIGKVGWCCVILSSCVDC